MQNLGGVLTEFQEAYVALRRAGRDEALVSLPFVPVLARPDLRKRHGRGVCMSGCAGPAASVQFARLRAAWELLPEGVRTRAHLILGVEWAGRAW